MSFILGSTVSLIYCRLNDETIDSLYRAVPVGRTDKGEGPREPMEGDDKNPWVLHRIGQSPTSSDLS